MKNILDIKETSSYLKVSIPKIRNLIRENKIPYYKVGAKYYFELDKINRWIDEMSKIEEERILLY